MHPTHRSAPRRWLLCVLGLATTLLLHACAHAPFATEGADADITPATAQAEPGATQGKTVIWGGQIVRAKNFETHTRLEIVSYPLHARSRQPHADQHLGPRFLVDREGYLETAEYEPGRSVTVRGRVAGTESGRIGEARYEYPLVQAEQLHLWPRAATTTQGPSSQFRFGVGISFSR